VFPSVAAPVPSISAYVCVSAIIGKISSSASAHVASVIFAAEVFAQSKTSALKSTNRSPQFVFVLADGQTAASLLRRQLAEVTDMTDTVTDTAATALF